MSPVCHPLVTFTTNTALCRYLWYGHQEETEAETLDGEEEVEGRVEPHHWGEDRTVQRQLSRQLILPHTRMESHLEGSTQ